MDMQRASTSHQAHRTGRSRPRNWPLIIGAFIIALVAVAAIAGPWLAPHDPMAQTTALFIGDRWRGPPYPPLTPGFWLGSDQSGRDLLSRLLWAVQPTMLLVLVIALLRLVIGIGVGLVAGYSKGFAQRAADGVMRAALLFPVLVVALAVIAFVGIQRGLFAFILGLTLTGWAETARYVETQTRAIRHEKYIESAASMGGSDGHLLIYHVLRHVLPLAAMLLAFEVSSTLMATASLGFLGYYIGGGAWLTVEDWSARRAAGLPELGQMLATSFELLFRPWPMIATGGVVMIIILGVTLVGEGLRRQLQGELELRPSLLDRALNLVAGWMARPDTPATSQQTRRWAAGLAAVLVAAGVIALLFVAGRPRSAATAFELTPPGGHFWATQRHDAAGTLSTTADGPLTPSGLWRYEHPAGFATSPVVDSNGTVYAATTDGELLAIDADGTLRWRVSLGIAPLGAPALAADGTLYVVDDAPGLSAVAPDGSIRWRVEMAGRRATSGPIVGADGTIYFSRADQIQAVNPDGTERWISAQVDGIWEEPPRLSPKYGLIFLGPDALSTVDGSRVNLQLPISQEMMFAGPRLAVGANGRHYLMSGNTALEWTLEQGKARVQAAIAWDLGGLTIYIPSDAGISPDTRLWLFYGQSFGNARLAWVDENNRLLANIEGGLHDALVVGIDPAGRAYLCGRVGGARCLMLDRATGSIGWDEVLSGGQRVLGGALAPGRLYVTTANGILYALGEQSTAQ